MPVKTRVRAFTLAETVVSAVSLTLLMAGMGSAILIATRSIPELGPDGESRLVASNRVAQEMIDELRLARWIKSTSPDELYFTIPDRDGDGDLEAIKYSWDGTSGSSLTRSYNGSGEVNVLSDVTEFTLEWQTKLEVESYPGPVAVDPTPIETAYTSPGGGEFEVSDSVSMGACFLPEFPEETGFWNLADFWFSTRGNSNWKTVDVYLQGEDGLPAGDAIDSVEIMHTGAPTTRE